MKFEVVMDKIIGNPEKNAFTGKNQRNHLFMIVWERLANSGIIYVWAKDETEAFAIVGYNSDYVKHTIVQISADNMPVEVGRKG